jgi:two-component system sensor histidine kinase HydH
MIPQGRLARGALVAAMALMGAALLATAWAAYAGVRDASALMIRGQIGTLGGALRADLVELGRPAEAADLTELVAAHAGEGLRFVALLGAEGVMAQGGTPSGTFEPARLPLGVPMKVGDRVRVVLRLAPRRVLRAGRPQAMVLEIEPSEVEAVRAAAARTVAIGAVAAATLLVVAVVLVRWLVRREKLERELERGRRLASLGQLSAVLAHEIRNPLASLKGNAQLLAASLPEGARAKADRVVAEAVRLESLTGDLLEFARTGDLRRAPVDPAALLARCASDGVNVDVTAAPRSWSLDEARMEQVLGNLLENGLQAGPPVSARVAVDGRRLLFEVADSGPGVPPEDRERIFEPFFTQKTRGTGLGLAVVKRVVELHGGAITVDEAPGGGARFRVWVPEG